VKSVGTKEKEEDYGKKDLQKMKVLSLPGMKE